MNDNIPSCYLEAMEAFTRAVYALPITLDEMQRISQLGTKMTLAYGNHLFNGLSTINNPSH